MKRGSFVRPRKPMNRVSAKVRAGKPAFDAVYDAVDRRSGGRCEVTLAVRDGFGMEPLVSDCIARWHCPAKATEHHHLRKPRRSTKNHRSELILGICKPHHNMTTASYRVGRLLIEPRGDGTFRCEISTKESKWA